MGKTHEGEKKYKGFHEVHQNAKDPLPKKKHSIEKGHLSLREQTGFTQLCQYIRKPISIDRKRPFTAMSQNPTSSIYSSSSLNMEHRNGTCVACRSVITCPNCAGCPRRYVIAKIYCLLFLQKKPNNKPLMGTSRNYKKRLKLKGSIIIASRIASHAAVPAFMCSGVKLVSRREPRQQVGLLR